MVSTSEGIAALLDESKRTSEDVVAVEVERDDVIRALAPDELFVRGRDGIEDEPGIVGMHGVIIAAVEDEDRLLHARQGSASAPQEREHGSRRPGRQALIRDLPPGGIGDVVTHAGERTRDALDDRSQETPRIAGLNKARKRHDACYVVGMAGTEIGRQGGPER